MTSPTSPFPPASSSPPLRGITLIELLVVIAIIAVLAALMFPVINRIIAASDSAKSIHQLRSVGVGILLYANDNDNTLPGPLFTSIQPRFRQSDTGQLATRIAPYLGYTVNNTWQAMPEMLFASWKKLASRYNPNTGGLSTLMCNWNDFDRNTIKTRPFGYPGHDPWSSGPIRLNQIPDPNRLWLVCEQAFTVNGQPTFLTKPNSRMFLFANGQVRLEPSNFVSYPRNL
ncbi:MAG: hypothetical protein Fur0032_22790 [Terrimicrobiaceae bacterium]